MKSIGNFLLWCYAGFLRLCAVVKSWFVTKPVAAIKKVKKRKKK
jgi:hypothetical protein